MYEYKYRKSYDTSPPAEWIEGDHSDDLDFIFGWDSEKMNEEEIKMKTTIMTYYTNFVHTG